MIEATCVLIMIVNVNHLDKRADVDKLCGYKGFTYEPDG